MSFSCRRAVFSTDIEVELRDLLEMVTGFSSDINFRIVIEGHSFIYMNIF